MSVPFEPGRNCWRTAKADDFSIIVDADHYFTAARRVMMAAKRSIFIVGWDFDASVTLGHPDADDSGPRAVGEFLTWLVKRTPDLKIRLLLWNPGLFTAWLKLSNAPHLLRWKFNRQIDVLLDGHHPVGSSHHQKILVIDDEIAFCGGIDVTLDRWDTRGHLDDDPRRLRPNGTPYDPWHDASSMSTGKAAVALGDLCRARWLAAGGEVLEPPEQFQQKCEAVLCPEARKNKELERFPASGKAGHVLTAGTIAPGIEGAFSFGPVEIAIARSAPAYGKREAVTEIETLYLDMIQSARRTIYAESQYFASRRVAQAIAMRLSEKDGPEIVLVNPFVADNWLGSVAMDAARARLWESLKRHDRHGRFRIYHPVTKAGTPIYVHSKLLIADDEYIRIGSSNLNNRSMRLDNECDVAIDSKQDPSGLLATRLMEFRDDLLAEHLGSDRQTVAAAVTAHDGSLIGAIENMREHRDVGVAGTTTTLVPYVTLQTNAVEDWLADHEILDPEGPESIFEPIEKRGLFRSFLKRPFKR